MLLLIPSLHHGKDDVKGERTQMSNYVLKKAAITLEDTEAML
jgi:hypothetical protein